MLQTVELVERARARVHAILLLDTSGSVAGEKLQQLTQAARAFVRGARSRGRGDALVLLLPRAPARRGGRLARSRPARRSTRLAAGGTTALVDAAAAATALADPRRGRPLVLVFSDGDDRVSFLRERQALDAARQSDVVFHAMGFAPARAGARERIGALPNQRAAARGLAGLSRAPDRGDGRTAVVRRHAAGSRRGVSVRSRGGEGTLPPPLRARGRPGRRLASAGGARAGQGARGPLPARVPGGRRGLAASLEAASAAPVRQVVTALEAFRPRVSSE